MPGLRNKINIHVSGVAFVLGALMILILPLKWLVAAVVAAVWHEVCHLIAVQLVGGRVRKISIGNTGAVMLSGFMDALHQLICIVAGPLGGALPILLIRWFPRLAVCATIYSLYNLLPVYPLDGGRALRCLASIFSIPERLCDIYERGVVLVLICLSLYAAVWLRLGLFPLIISGIILLKTKSAKTLAN